MHHAKTHARQHNHRLDAILKLVCANYAVAPEQVRSSVRTPIASRARKMYCWLAHKHTDAAFIEIGGFINATPHAAQRLAQGVEQTHNAKILQEAQDLNVDWGCVDG